MTVERAREERGFTLIELLVVMVAGVVVTSALFTILDVTLHQTTRTFSRVDATQRARNALETIEQEMHSSCVANGVTPILAGSTANSVSFWNYYGKDASPVPVKRTISFSSSGSGTLTDATYPVTPPDDRIPPWTTSSTASRTTTLLNNVAQSGSTPVFRYFALSSNGTSNVSTEIQNPSATTAPKVSEVRISLLVKPAGGSHEDVDLVHNTVTDSVLLRLTPVSNPDGTVQEFAPCQ
jgi:prepilin-type N-terminal cleavage/methylation domain-containing protein